MKYSIILPVRNGGEYVKECVASILNQAYYEFDLAILDNFSTDGTTGWLESLSDRRVKLYHAKEPLGIEDNWKRIVGIPKNEFITMIGHDDILDRNYLTTMDALINKNPDATLFQTHFRYIDSKGELIRRSKPMDYVQSAEEFLAFFLSGTIDTMGTGFMMRAKDYDELGGIPERYPNLLYADFELFINLTAKGYKATAAEECFAFRLHQSMTTTSTDLKFHKAYEEFIGYLEKLQTMRPAFREIINRYAIQFISNYGRGLSHRLLRTPSGRREGNNVASLLARNKQFADRLVPENNYHPDEEFSVKMALRIDNNFLLRKMFTLFKKMYPTPVYK